MCLSVKWRKGKNPKQQRDGEFDNYYRSQEDIYDIRDSGDLDSIYYINKLNDSRGRFFVVLFFVFLFGGFFCHLNVKLPYF